MIVEGEIQHAQDRRSGPRRPTLNTAGFQAVAILQLEPGRPIDVHEDVPPGPRLVDLFEGEPAELFARGVPDANVLCHRHPRGQFPRQAAPLHGDSLARRSCGPSGDQAAERREIVGPPESSRKTGKAGRRRPRPGNGWCISGARGGGRLLHRRRVVDADRHASAVLEVNRLRDVVPSTGAARAPTPKSSSSSHWETKDPGARRAHEYSPHLRVLECPACFHPTVRRPKSGGPRTHAGRRPPASGRDRSNRMR
jgi:hypothetical protein